MWPKRRPIRASCPQDDFLFSLANCLQEMGGVNGLRVLDEASGAIPSSASDEVFGGDEGRDMICDEATGDMLSMRVMMVWQLLRMLLSI